LLHREGILSGQIRVESAYWSDKTNGWLITLHQPSGLLSHWFVDAKAQNYQNIDPKSHFVHVLTI
jgi:hypothetical protein